MRPTRGDDIARRRALAGRPPPPGHPRRVPRCRPGPRRAGAHADAAALARDPVVRRRIDEYLGAGADGGPSAVFLARPGPWCEAPFEALPLTRLPGLLAAGDEISRSLWDRRSLVAHLDLEHVDFDRPWRSLADRPRSLALQRPAVAALLAVLRDEGVAPLRLLTGRGHHLVWRVSRDGEAFAALASLGGPPASVSEWYARPLPPSGEHAGEALGRAQDGLGRVLERVVHRALERLDGASPVPVQVTAVAVGPGAAGRREIVSLDLSPFADPLPVRSLRIPFSRYAKARALGAPAEVAERFLVTVPVRGDDEARAIGDGEDPRRARRLAAEVSTAVPEAEAGMRRLVAEYRASGLARFHAAWDEDAAAADPQVATGAALPNLPPCVRGALERPNDRLLQPAILQLVTRSLLACGWSPRAVAGLVHARLAGDHEWIAGLHFHEPGIRAEVYVRLFAGLVAAGRDRLVDFNCRSSQEKGLCPGGPCGWNLLDLAPRVAGGRHDG